MCFLAMPLPLLLASALFFCTGEALGDIVSLKIQAIAGETVILPCKVSVKVDAVIPSVEWSKEHLYPTIAFLYRDGCETFEEKNQTFQYRTNLFLKELKSGNASLRLSDVQLSDAGTYKCKTIEKGKRPLEVGSIELSVEFKMSWTPLIIIAVIEPIILCVIFAFLYKTGVFSVGDKNGFLPKQHTKVPQTEEDDNGKKQIDELQRKICDLESKLNDQEEINSKLKEELKDFKSKLSPAFHEQHTIVHIPSPDVSKPMKTQSKFPHDDNPTPAASTNNNHQSSVSLPQNKDSKPVVPTQIPALPQIRKGKQSHSSPALLTKNDEVSPSSPSASSSSQVQCSMSMFESGSRSNGAKPQRRNTFSYPFPSVNRFSPLANLPEDDSMPLLE